MLLAHQTTLVGGLVLLLSFVVAQSDNDLGWVPFDRLQFDANATLDEDGDVRLFWTVGNNYSTYGIASRSNGYLALGFSETGAMTGADMAVGYNDQDGNFVFENRHAGGFVTPQLSEDQEDNMRLRESYKADGVTSFVFEKRNKAECLENQVDVHIDSWQWFIYAFSDENTFAQHGPGQNGKQYIKLGNGTTISTNVVRSIPNTMNFTISQPEVEIPTAETTYCYSLHKMPEGRRNFLLGERPNESSPLLHHLVLYACYGMPDELLEMLDQPANCDWENFANPCNGFVTEWAPGMSGRTFEEGYGKPFGSELYEYAMFETHYNNPEGIEGETDAASYTFTYTDEQVDTEIGTLTLGDLQVEGWFLEPGKELVAHSTTCTPECTERWPAEGITAVSVFHHMHFRGRNARVQIIRDGVEIDPLSVLHDFEYGYQFSKALDQIKLLPGDRLITTCEFNTMNDTEPAPGGQGSQDEMCFAWVDYYPANDVLACTQINMGNLPENPINGTVAMCLLSDEEEPDIYPSAFLTATFQNFTTSGDTCPSSTSPGTNGSSQAALVSTCPETEVCFSLNVPEKVASSGSGDIFFQLSAPTTYSWVALAQGTRMSNANMFVMYSSADGANVTLSPRTTPEHVMPTHNDAADITILDGTGISDGRMTANVRCGNCHEWSSGSMSVQGGSSDWLYAYLQGPAIDSDDLDAAITQHGRMGNFQWDLSRAIGGSSANPFADAAATTASSSGSGSESVPRQYGQAHGALASIAFVGIFPIGAILVRLASMPGLAWIHGGLQLLGYALFIAAAGLGIYMADVQDLSGEPHAIIGVLLFVIFFFMPFGGALHHKMYKKVQKRTLWSYGHIFTGRAGIILGMVNGGLGLHLADAGRSSIIAYGVIAGLMGVVYIGAIVFGENKRRQGVSQQTMPYREPKRQQHSDSGRESSREHSLQ